MQIIGTGLSGLVGSRIVELLSDKYSFKDLSRKNNVDILDKDIFLKETEKSDSQFLLHLAAFTDIEAAEKEKDLKEKSSAWKINVEGTSNAIEVCRKTNKKLIYFSTDMVFSGEKKIGEKYSEEDSRNPVGWYATTKKMAEELIEKSNISWVILRIAYPYRANYEKKEYVRIFKWLLENQKPIKAVSDHYFTPTFIDDIAPVIDFLIKNNIPGKFNLVGDEIVTPFKVALMIADVFKLNKDLISQTTRAEFFKDRAPRGYNISLKNDKIIKLGLKLRSFTEGLMEIKKQI